MTTRFIDHHLLTTFSICNTCLDLLEIHPETDAIVDLKNLMLEQYEIIDCMIHSKHYGTDQLDFVIKKCQEINDQIIEYERKD
jgi:hypothetical protein